MLELGLRDRVLPSYSRRHAGDGGVESQDLQRASKACVDPCGSQTSTEELGAVITRTLHEPRRIEKCVFSDNAIGPLALNTKFSVSQ